MADPAKLPDWAAGVVRFWFFSREAAVETAKTVMTKAPLSLMLAKRMVDAALDLDHRSGIRMENLAFSVLTSTQDKLEGTTAFLEKRPPEYQGK